MFKVTRGSGFQITFENGWTVSAQFGWGTYSSNHGEPRSWVSDRIAGAEGSETAEIAAWDANGNWYQFEHDTVAGYKTADEVAAFIAEIAAMPKA